MDLRQNTKVNYFSSDLEINIVEGNSKLLSDILLLPNSSNLKIENENIATLNKQNDDYIINAIGKLRKFYPNILKLEYENKISSNEVLDNIDIDKSNMSPIDLFSEFYKMQNGIELPAKKKKIIEEVIKEVSDEAN